MKSVFALCRVSNLPTVWMNVLTAVVLTTEAINQPVIPGDVILLILALSTFYCGGMCLNDLYDRHWDADHQPFRPIPSGLVGLRQAQIITVTLFAGGLVLLLFAPDIRGLWIGFVLLAVIYLYNCYHKRYPVTVLLMAIARLLVFIVCAEAITGQISVGVWIAGGLAFCYTLLIAVVARHENSRRIPYRFPLIPRMIAGMAVLDGSVLAVMVSPQWFTVGFTAALLTHFSQRYVRGD